MSSRQRFIGDGIIVFALAKMKGGQDFRDWIDGQPQPHLAGESDPTIEFVQLNQFEEQMVEEPVMKENTVLPGSFEPSGDGGFAMSRATYENRDITAFGEKHQDQDDMIFSSFQAIEGSV